MDTFVDGLVDLDRYPVLDTDGAGFRAMVEDARAQLAGTGAAELAGFLNPTGVDALVAGADALAPARTTRLARARPTSSSPTSACPTTSPA